MMLASAMALTMAGCGSNKQSDSAETTYACRMIDYYDYSTPVPAAETVDDSYFQDTFFGGDSRMGSLYLYSDLRDKGAEIYYAESMRVYTMDTMPVQELDGKTTLAELLDKTEKKNIYLLLGINEIRSDNFDDWASYYDEEVIQPILKRMPDAHIYLMLNYHVREVTGLDTETLDQHLKMINDKMIEIAKKNHIYYLDVDDEMTDTDGMIKEEYVWDGLHFNVEGAEAYADYIARHTVKEDAYVKEVCE